MIRTSDPFRSRSGALLLCLALLAALPAAAQDWTGTGRVQGQVIDESGEPIAGAKVEIFLGAEGRGPEPVETNARGRWAFLGINYGVWSVRITKENYIPSEGNVQVGSQSRGTVRNTLREIPESQRVDPKAVAAKQMLDIGNEHLNAGRYAEARASYEEAMANLDPQYHPMILREVARAHYQEGNVAAAIDTLKQLLETEPENAQALKLVSEMLVAEGREAEAQEYAARLPDDMKLDPDSLANIGIDLYNDGKLGEAAEHFGGLIADYPDYALAYYYRGVAMLGMLGSVTDPDESQQLTGRARADFEKFLELDPESAKAAEAQSFLEYLSGS